MEQHFFMVSMKLPLLMTQTPVDSVHFLLVGDSVTRRSAVLHIPYFRP